MDIRQTLDKLGFADLNAMQKNVSDAFLHSDKDIIVLSPTGSGKTLAYLLPLMQILDAASSEVQAVVIVPGRELALQSAMVHQSLGSGLRSCACYGGRMTIDEHRTLKQVKPQIIFATPGRLNDHLDKGNISPGAVKFLIIDEFDKCLEMGFNEEMKAIIEKLPYIKRRVLLSATDAELVPKFVHIGHSIRIDYSDTDNQVPERVHIYKVSSSEKDKLDTLNGLLRSLGNGSSIVFLNYRDSIERTDNYLVEQGFTTSILHGGMDQKMRENALYKFSNGSANILVSTDLASRGLDIPDIDNIIHYHLPESQQGYVHRVGRTARWKKSGRTFFILGPNEIMPEYIHDEPEVYAIPTELPPPSHPRMATLYIGKGKKDKISRGDIVGFLCRKGGLKGSDIGRIDVKERYAYVAVAREKADHLLVRIAGEKIKGVKTIVESVR